MQFTRASAFPLVSSRIVPVVLASLSLSACFDDDTAQGGAVAQSGSVPVASTGATATNAAPVVGGVPAAAIPAGFPYVFKPTVSDPDGDPLSFTISGLPTWAEFNPATGELRGTPTMADVGETGGIVITVTDGKAKTAFGPFRVLINRPANAATNGLRPPVISGTPPVTVVAGTGYSFQATASDPDGDKLTFGASNLPAWLGLNTANGMITGTPSLAQVGTYANISISVTDGGSTVTLPPFTITVTAPASAPPGTTTPAEPGTAKGTATVSWARPTRNADGSPLTDLAGFVVKYGNSPTSLTQRLPIDDPSMTRYTVQNLGRGTWFFTVVSYTVSGVESDVSQVVSKTIS
jgi:hypothetical protein